MSLVHGHLWEMLLCPSVQRNHSMAGSTRYLFTFRRLNSDYYSISSGHLQTGFLSHTFEITFTHGSCGPEMKNKPGWKCAFSSAIMYTPAHWVLVLSQAVIDKQKIITEPPSPTTNNSLTKIEERETAFNVCGYAGIISACYRLVVKGLGVAREARRGGCSCGGKMYKLASTVPQHSSSGETEDLNSDTVWEDWPRG